MATLDDRVTALEARLGVGVDPRVLTPPITIGDLTNVPVPGSQLAAQWAQDASTRVMHVFANKAAIDAWAAPNGAYAHDTGTGVLWYRIGGQWSQLTPWHGTGVGIAAGAAQGTSGQIVVASLTIPADPGPRTVHASLFLCIAVGGSYRNYVELLVDNQQVAIADIPIGTQNDKVNICLAGCYNLPTGRGVNVQTRVSPEVGALGAYNTVAGPQYNRVDATVSPRGY